MSGSSSLLGRGILAMLGAAFLAVRITIVSDGDRVGGREL